MEKEKRLLQAIRQTAAHVLAQAVKQLYGAEQVKLGASAVTEDGFYYDFDVAKPFTSEDLDAIEKEMEQIIREDRPIASRLVSREDAALLLRLEPYKLELLSGQPEQADGKIALYAQGNFLDLQEGAPLSSTGAIKAMKLLHAAGAYWQADASKRMLQRVYGTAFAKKAQLKEHLLLLEEAQKRDHRKLGRELELFMFSEEAPGMPFYLPNGLVVRSELESFLREAQNRQGYREGRSPLMMNRRLWEHSGHWDHYKDNMYFTQVDEDAYALKPMNCPGHMLVFKNSLHSYRELPIRLAEFGQVHRHEFSGALNGMMRVRTFCQDDAHLFVRPEQIEEEIAQVISLISQVYGVFGFSYSVELSTRPEDSMGSAELWETAEKALSNVLEKEGIPYRINEGDGAFYGPKIDFHIRDALKRSWQCGTIQLDFQMPQKFGLTYVGEDGGKHCPVVIHRAVYGSIDRFMGMLTEHYAGAFPVWLAPVQVKVLAVSEAHADYALAVREALWQEGIRAEADLRREKLGYKIRQAQMEKIPYMLVVGDAEAAGRFVSARKREVGDLGSMSPDEMIRLVRQDIAARK
ncbi:threonine--tRNA ligase [Paenibacillus sp. YN15]|uniref:threonine--tRNA ligase n=1 Tax=Paenibacillus sp. YN15 TaxID=1742774 RepID=UPI00215C4AE5|nr:threonine--tRNA ligase [Paenibacillus sp. YN15]